MDIICVVLGADTKNYRTKDSIKLIEYCFNNFEVVNINELINTSFNEWKNNNLKNITIEKSFKGTTNIEFTNLKFDTIPIEKSLVNNITCKIDCNLNLKAPIAQNSIIGTIEIKTDKNTITTCDIILTNEITKNTIFDYIKFFFKNYQNILLNIKI